MEHQIDIEVVYASAEEQALISLSLSGGSTVADALSASGLEKRFPSVDFSKLQTGIWGQIVTRDKVLAKGDRVEVYRPLQLDPKEARRQLAALGLTMGGGTKS